MDKNQVEIVDAGDWGEAEREAYRAIIAERYREEFFFIDAFAPSPFHWHFQQAYEALKGELFLPGVSGLLNGIEASLRTTVCYLDGRPLEGDLGTVMSNSLLREARDHGIDVQALAFPGEAGFAAALASNQKQDAVKIVRLRNDLCHGNFQSYVGDNAAAGQFFTPECLGPVSAVLLNISFNWAKQLAAFLHARGLRSESADDLEAPANPLSKWLV